jgi:hypothetical protein
MDSGAGRPRALPADGMFCRPGSVSGSAGVAGADYGGPLTSWMGNVIRLRRGADGPPGYDNDPWWLRKEHQSAIMAAQLRVLGKEKKAPGSGRMWRAAVPAEQRTLITRTIESAEEQLLQLRGAQSGSTADVAQQFVRVAFTVHPQRRLRITSLVRPDQCQQVGTRTGSASRSRLRPPPGPGQSAPRRPSARGHHGTPWTSQLLPQPAATRMPPSPSTRAAAPSTRRRCRSSTCGNSKANTSASAASVPSHTPVPYRPTPLPNGGVTFR